MSADAGSDLDLDLARTVADAVLYEGYLLYPYRASSRKNQVRWQFGVLGPPGAAAAGVGEESGMAAEVLLQGSDESVVTVRLRFLQLQVREAQVAGTGGFTPVPQLTVGDTSWLTWDEAVEHELTLPAFRLGAGETAVPVELEGGEEVERLDGQNRLVRRRWPLAAEVRVSRTVDGGVSRLRLAVDNVADAASDKDDAIRRSFIGAHLLLTVEDGTFVSLLEPPAQLAAAAARCEQRRCWPVLAGRAGGDTGPVVLASPIILYDHPEVAEQSAGALFDSTEIDEILTLRVMTLTEEEKQQARATDPKAAQIIDRCDQMTPEQLQQLHGILRDPGLALDADAELDLSGGLGFDDEVPWWDPAVDGSVQPDRDVVMIGGVPVSGGSRVRIHPRRRADAQDLFFAEQEARVTAVHSDVDGNTHVAVVLADDPAADLHDWYGRYLYFAPDELEPLATDLAPDPHTDDRREDL